MHEQPSDHRPPAKPVAHPVRTRPAHGVLEVDGQPTIVFLTVCTKDREPWLATREMHDLLVKVWSDATAWLVGRYVVMPDHIHLFAGRVSETIPFDNWAKYWKSQFRKSHRLAERRLQSDHWDTRMRNARQYEEKWEYVRNNPVRHSLVERAEEWPYQGEVFILPWE